MIARWRKLGFVAAAIVASLAFLPAAGASSATGRPERAGDGCGRCKFVGTLPCTKHNKEAVKREEAALFCSVAARCPACRGTFQIDCPDCQGDAQANWQAAFDDAGRKIEQQKEFEKLFGGEPKARLFTEHFELTFDIENLTVGQRQLETHELLHLYADRMAKVYADFNEIFGLRNLDHRCSRYRVMIWRNPLDHREASTRFADGASKLYGGAKQIYTFVRDRNAHAQDEDLHRSVVHNVVHLYLADLFDGVWIGQRKCGWADEGLAHWFEDKYFGKCTNFCYQEQNTLVGFRGGKWRTPVRGMVESGKAAPFAEVGNKSNDELKVDEHALAFSYCDFLIAKDAAAFMKMIRAYQKKKATRDALQEAYGFTMAGYEEAWKKWVLETYSKR